MFNVFFLCLREYIPYFPTALKARWSLASRAVFSFQPNCALHVKSLRNHILLIWINFIKKAKNLILKIYEDLESGFFLILYYE
jgi:hypothetical protein